MGSIHDTFASRNASNAIEFATCWGLRLFVLLVSLVSLRNAPQLFLSSHGQSHRLVGGLLFVWIILGVCTCGIDARFSGHYVLLYDVVLGCLGTATTLTAARDFPHKLINNEEGQSGSLSETAIVTQAEMIEHAFYQVLNLVQILFLHGMAFRGTSMHISYRIGALLLATCPWTIRRRFPVHSFRANWTKMPKEKQKNEEVLLYMIKKSQYIFYKHFVLHGLNISICLKPSSLPWTRAWRIFWLHLIVSYGMEFFLQSLVKRKHLRQREMLHLQRILITSATLSAVIPIVGSVQFDLCMASLTLNFVNRYHDLFNTALIALASVLVRHSMYIEQV